MIGGILACVDGLGRASDKLVGTMPRNTAMWWIDTHCHLDAPEFGAHHALAVSLRERAATLGVGLCVIPAVERSNFDTVRRLAHRLGDAYALGIHPLFVPSAQRPTWSRSTRH